MRGPKIGLSVVVAALAACLLMAGVASAAPLERVLVFSETAGFRHDSIPAGITAIQELGAANGFAVDATEDSTQFNDANLAQYQAVIFLSTTGDVLSDTEQAAFERYIAAGQRLRRHPRRRRHRVRLGLVRRPGGRLLRRHIPPARRPPRSTSRTPTHPSTTTVPARWTRDGRVVQLQAARGRRRTAADDYSPRYDVHVLARLDETTYDEQDGPTVATAHDDHPIAWCSNFAGGHSFYTGMRPHDRVLSPTRSSARTCSAASAP